MEELLNTKTLVTLMLAIGGAGGVISLLKNAPAKIWKHIKHKFVFSVTIYKHDSLYQYFESWFFDNYSHKFKNVEIINDRDNVNLESTNKQDQKLQYGQKSGYFFITYLDSIFYVVKDKIDRKGSNLSDPFLDFYVIESFSSLKLKQLIDYLYEQKSKDREIHLYCSDPNGYWQFYKKLKNKSIDSIILPIEQKENLFADIQEFTVNEQWYLDRSIPYNRGYLFHGLPGNGKSSLVLSIAEKFQRSLYSLDLNSLRGDSDLRDAFNRIPNNSVILLEDVDKSFTKRDGVNKQITFSGLLNCIDGAFQKSGLILIMTTNHIENLDPALIRDGRIDYKLEIFNPTLIEVNQYFRRFYQDSSISINQITGELSMANIQGICLKNKTNHLEAKKLIEYSNSSVNLTKSILEYAE